VCPKEEHKHAARTDPVHGGLVVLQLNM
jgi:hypothetical protein